MTVHDYVSEFFLRTREPALGTIADACDVAVSPDGDMIAFTAHVPLAVDQDPVRRAALLDLRDGGVTLRDGPDDSHQPRWSPGGRLAWLTGDGGVEVAGRFPGAAFRAVIPGVAEYLAWSPDGERLLVGGAEPGAELTDVAGSGRIPLDATRPGWAPEVSEGEPVTGRRRVWIVDPTRGTTRCLPGELNIWQAAWAGPDRLVCVTSGHPGESAWYAADLTLLHTRDGSVSTVPLGAERQLGLPAGAPGGGHVSVVTGAMSDRGIYTGRLVVIPDGGEPEEVDTAGVDVSDQSWLDDDRVLFAGLRGLETVIGTHSLATGETRVLWESARTCGPLLPVVAAGGETVAAVVHGYDLPPALAVIRDGAAETVLDLANQGSAHLLGLAGTLRPVRWRAPDGQSVEGLLALPPGDGPFALVVYVHGGPVWAWRNEWSMHYAHTPLLVGRGYAVLHVNMRGSAGRGQDFAVAGLRDMGGVDAADILSGVDALVAGGLADGGRVGVTGNSYGGFMAAWLVATSDRFAAAVARSPVTDWVSQHHTSNLPGFDAFCLHGDPLDPASDYRTRSPLYRADHVNTPIMLMAGAHDLATPPEQAAMFHRALVERGRPSTLVIYPEEGHGVRHHLAVADQCVRLLEFLERHMPAENGTNRTRG